MELLKLKGINNGMKKIFSFLCLFFICCSLSAQQIQETIYLRNGSVIKGNIVEQIPNGSVKIQIADGSLLVYQMSEVERITKERKQSSKKEGRHRGLDFSVDAGYHIAIGKRFNKNFYWEIGTGAFIPTSDGDPSIPLTFDFKVYFPLKSTSLTLGGLFVLDMFLIPLVILPLEVESTKQQLKSRIIL